MKYTTNQLMDVFSDYHITSRTASKLKQLAKELKDKKHVYLEKGMNDDAAFEQVLLDLGGKETFIETYVEKFHLSPKIEKVINDWNLTLTPIVIAVLLVVHYITKNSFVEPLPPTATFLLPNVNMLEAIWVFLGLSATLTFITSLVLHYVKHIPALYYRIITIGVGIIAFPFGIGLVIAGFKAKDSYKVKVSAQTIKVQRYTPLIVSLIVLIVYLVNLVIFIDTNAIEGEKEYIVEVNDFFEELGVRMEGELRFYTQYEYISNVEFEGDVRLDVNSDIISINFMVNGVLSCTGGIDLSPDDPDGEIHYCNRDFAEEGGFYNKTNYDFVDLYISVVMIDNIGGFQNYPLMTVYDIESKVSE